MFAYSLQTLLQTEDGSYAFFDCKDEDAYDPATSFFFDRLMPVIQPMVTAKCVEDRAASFDCFEKVCCYLPQTPLLNLITKKKVWGCFEKAMRLSLKQRKMPTNEAVKSSWESYLSHIVLCNLARVLEGFTCTCMVSFNCSTSFYLPHHSCRFSSWSSKAELWRFSAKRVKCQTGKKRNRPNATTNRKV